MLTFLDEVDVGDHDVVLVCQFDDVALLPQPLVLHHLRAIPQALDLLLQTLDTTLLRGLHLMADFNNGA